MKRSSVNIFVLLGFFFLCFKGSLFAQSDTVLVNDTSEVTLITTSDSSLAKNDTLIKPVIHNPKRAAILSAILPGAGQFYNRKYWKIPIIWAGLGTMSYYFQNNDFKYRDFKKAYLLRVDDNPATIDDYELEYSEDNLLILMDQHRRTRDLFAVGIIVFYVLNVVDANVDAHLFSFDVSDDLSLNLTPSIYSDMFLRRTPAFTLTAKF